MHDSIEGEEGDIITVETIAAKKQRDALLYFCMQGIRRSGS